jgi:hypothetical protein
LAGKERVEDLMSTIEKTQGRGEETIPVLHVVIKSQMDSHSYDGAIASYKTAVLQEINLSADIRELVLLVLKHRSLEAKQN